MAPNYLGEIFQFKCLECDLEFKFEVKGRENKPSRILFYCEKCKIVTSNHQCEKCRNYLKRIIFTRKGQTIPINVEGDEYNVTCPHCHSNNTVLVPLTKWVMDYQVW